MPDVGHSAAQLLLLAGMSVKRATVKLEALTVHN